jgi:hypothetical protein
MRRAVILLSLISCGAAAQQHKPPPLEPVAPAPPAVGAPQEPEVRIPVQKGDKIEAIREGGRVVMMKVTPPSGKPYYLVDTTGNGNWMRKDSLDDGNRVPMYEIKTFD